MFQNPNKVRAVERNNMNKMKEIELEIRKICTIYDKDYFKSRGEENAEYSLTEEQFEKIFDLIKKNFVAKGDLRKIIAELILKSQMENEIKFGDGWGNQEPNYKLVVDKILKSLE